MIRDIRCERGPEIKTILTIAGFDPSSGAGVTADLAVIAAHGFFGTAAITALTVQSTMGVFETAPVDCGLLRRTLDCLLSDLPPGAIKIGMLGTAENVATVAEFLETLREKRLAVPVVLDPVLRSSSGRELLSADGTALLKARLLPLVDWVTPNLAELQVLTGAEELASARELTRLYPALNVVGTGGDSESADDFVALLDGTAGWVRGRKMDSRATHGTGCAFSTSLACCLASGARGMDAARQAKYYVTEAIRRAGPIGYGTGPMDLLWLMRKG